MLIAIVQQSQELVAFSSALNRAIAFEKILVKNSSFIASERSLASEAISCMQDFSI